MRLVYLLLLNTHNFFSSSFFHSLRFHVQRTNKYVVNVLRIFMISWIQFKYRHIDIIIWQKQVLHLQVTNDVCMHCCDLFVVYFQESIEPQNLSTQIKQNPFIVAEMSWSLTKKTTWLLPHQMTLIKRI